MSEDSAPRIILSIVGFDGQAPLPESLFPALTTVALPHYEMGAWAVARLAEAIDGEEESIDGGYTPALLSCPIVERESAGPVAGRYN
ncbi:MAG: substrate-binding domain-containing protein [Propionibacteriaceae bacterium]|nr:substrate-binding domain-containing protein [Propionibacteriaceae bacterium]